MEITLEELDNRILGLENQRDKALAEANFCQGAILALNGLKLFLEKKDENKRTET